MEPGESTPWLFHCDRSYVYHPNWSLLAQQWQIFSWAHRRQFIDPALLCEPREIKLAAVVPFNLKNFRAREEYEHQNENSIRRFAAVGSGLRERERAVPLVGRKSQCLAAKPPLAGRLQFHSQHRDQPA